MKYTLDIQKAQFDEQGLAITAGWAEVYICDPMTREYARASLDNVPFGGSVVADAYLDKPELPVKENIAIIRSEDEKSWLHITDYRGKTAYSTETRQPMEIDFIGDLPDTLTLLEPKTEFDKWNGKKWVTDTEAQKAMLVEQAEQEKAQRLEEANATITYLQDAIEVGLDDDDYQAKLTAWKTYRVLLSRVDTSTAPDIDWPEKPE
ncbi:tail fiber assembly protein [Providencia sp. Me1]|uniref:Tail fiber assembly protein n=1 Tax=Providencia rettgeri TaxID=587 RepID=A0AAJ4NJH9_PRORE|nr:tail fiber assembly protein [Providencia rettgeri]ELL9153389.1 tail fiber assembly protein [Providencia rettgeri]QWQ16854.1 tail fiber assembly protein [Providencia rettgeri]QWQ20688.1 tail fiber assembly protein [Providencia rettgeri]QWQ23229.1 tail fiber assembly protein [Providencia rettgeri]QWQ24523.1 tail fiber assembly protein [Providencia rettgeri]